jgi:hypothetical protein
MHAEEKVLIRRAIADISAQRDLSVEIHADKEYFAYANALDILKRYLPDAFVDSSHRIRREW